MFHEFRHDRKDPPGQGRHEGIAREPAAENRVVRPGRGYRCKEYVRTWLIGWVKEPRAFEKLKPMLAATKGGVTDKLAGQATAEFYLVRESSVTLVFVQSDLCLGIIPGATCNPRGQEQNLGIIRQACRQIRKCSIASRL